MAVPSKPFFELGPAAAISRSLVRRGEPLPSRVAPRPSVEAPRSAPPPASVSAPSIRPFRRSRVRYAAELWSALLEWAAEGIGADGAFAVDERGFPIATAGASFPAPVEVLLAAFTSVEQLLAPYSEADAAVEQVALRGSGPAMAHLYRMEWRDEALLLGFVGGRLPADTEIGEICHTMASELDRFAASTNP